jgi:UPF0716 protein FxsA
MIVLDVLDCCQLAKKAAVLLKLLLIFITVPFIELALLLYIADVTRWEFTLLLVVATGIVGSLLARSQGWRTYTRIQSELAGGRLPAQSMLDAVMIFVAGALLLTPGILTDLFGLSLLVPPCRAFYRKRLVKWFKSRFTIQTTGYGDWQSPPPQSEVIDSYVIDNSPDGETSSMEGDSDGQK